MQKEIILYPEAQELQQLGFDDICFGYYCSVLGKPGVELIIRQTPPRFYHLMTIPEHFDILAPTYSQAFRWFREKYRLNSETPYLPNVEKYGIIVSDMTIKPKDLSNNENFKRGVEVTNNFAKYDTHEEAELDCLRHLIKLVKEGRK